MSLREIDINVELGQKARAMRQRILAVSLAKPENYYELKDKIETQIVQALTRVVYSLFKELLSKGQINGTQLKYKDASNAIKDYNPELPMGLVEKFSINISSMMEEEIYKAINFILPDKASSLADQKAEDILQAKTGMK